MPNIHNSFSNDEQWAFLSSATSQDPPSTKISAEDDYSAGHYRKGPQTDKQRWRIADTKAPFDLHKLIGDFGSWYERVVDGHGCHFSSSMDSDLPKFFLGNPLMLGFLLWDLGSYSRNFLDGDGVDLEVCSRSIGGDWYSIGFSLMVSGSGSGRQRAAGCHSSGSRGTRAAGGHSGTNLYYAGMIAAVLNGRVSVLNDSGIGTEFSAEICLQQRAG